jgi:hypothetical protein
MIHRTHINLWAWKMEDKQEIGKKDLSDRYVVSTKNVLRIIQIT